MTSSFSVLSPVVSSGVVAPALPMGIEVAVKKKLFKTRGSGLWIDLEEFAGNLVFIKFPLVVCENFAVEETELGSKPRWIGTKATILRKMRL